MAILTVINNPFDINDKTTTEIKACTVYNAIERHIKNFSSKDYDFIFSVNGVVIDNLAYKLKEDDSLAIVPIGGAITGGGNKDIARAVAMIALMVAAPYLAPYLATTIGVSTAVASGMIMVGGGLLINAMIPMEVESYASGSSLSETSSTYAFSGGSNAVTEGTALPIVLGKAKITPPILSNYLSLDGDNQHLNTLLAINDGMFDSISDVQVNSLDVESFTDINYEVRYGENEQTPTSNFTDEITTVSDGRALNDTSTIVEYQTSSNAINELKIGMLLPKGLFKVENNGNYSDVTVSFELKYKKSTDTEWKYHGTTETDVYKYVYTITDCDDTGCSPAVVTEVDSYLGTYSTYGRYVKKYKVETLVEDYNTITDTYKSAKRLVYTIKDLELDTYDVMITRVTEYDENTRVANDLTFEYINEITYDDISYPNTGLLAINAQATDQLSGSFPTITAVVENKYLRYWNDTGIVQHNDRLLNNPAWAVYYILKKANFSDDNIDLVEFQSWADYCEEKNYICNLVIDSQMELPSILNLISPLGRAKVVQKGTKWSVIVDRVVSLPTQSFLFTSGNIIDGSFSLDYIPYTDRANTIEVTYYDEDNDYQATTTQAQADNYDNTLDEVKTSITYYGCTTKDMASRYAQYLINNNRYISETVNFTASIDSLACTVGDVVKCGVKYLSNNIADGRIESVTDINTITLDNEVTFEANKTYQIDIRTEDDNIHSVEVLNTEDTTKEITLVNNTIVFNKYDVYTIGETDNQSNLYRVVSITRDDEFTRKISAIEYIPEVYDDDLVVPEQSVIILDKTTNLTAYETLVERLDGGIDEILTISWNDGILTNSIYLDNELVGTSNTNSYQLINKLIRGKTYTIKVNNTSINYTYNGLLIEVDAVSNLNIELDSDNTILSWERVPFASGYKIYHNDVLLDEKIVATSYNYKLLSSGTHTFKIEALNIGGESGASLEATATVSVPLNPTINLTYDGAEVVVEWQESNSTYPIRHYVINHDSLETISKTTTYKTKVNWLTNNITVKAVDVVGNESSLRTVTSNIEIPSVTGITSKVIDNNILLYWNYTEKTLPIEKIEMKQGTDFNTATLIGNRVGTFTTLFETLEGYYTYWFTPIDTAGNRGVTKSTTAFMNEPPDYILNVQWYSDFSGTKVNALIEDDYLLMGINTTETFAQHFTNNSNTTPQGQIDKGYPYYLQPNKISSYYEEIFDYGTIIGATGITVTLDYDIIDNSSFQIDISVSDDNTTWTDYTNVSKIIESDFRYAKVRITTSSDDAGFFKLNQLEVRLDSKIKNDGGSGTSSLGSGTVVNFNKTFTDITSLIVTAKGTTAKTAIYDFEDVPNPTSFTVYVFDSNGNQLTSDFSWSAKGY